MGFDASQAVTELEWDFTAYGAGSGTSPEPSDLAIMRFQRKQMRLATATVEDVRLTKQQLDQDDKEVQIVKLIPLKEALSAIAAIDGTDERGALVMRQMAEIVAEALSDCPTADQIMKLPLRIRSAYYGWITGQLLNPESYAAVTTPILRAVNGG
jgi:hypothetical protein